MAVEITTNEITFTVADLRELRRLDVDLYIERKAHTFHLLSLKSADKLIEDERWDLDYLGDTEMLVSAATHGSFYRWRKGEEVDLSAMATHDVLHAPMAKIIDWSARMEIRAQFRAARKNGGQPAIIALYEELSKWDAFTWLTDEYTRTNNLRVQQERFEREKAAVEADEGSAVLRVARLRAATERRDSYFKAQDEPVRSLLEEIYGEEADEA